MFPEWKSQRLLRKNSSDPAIMKHAACVIPGIALVCVASVLAVQQRSIFAAENENRRLRSLLEIAESERETEASFTSKEDNKPINWKTFSSQLAEMRHSGGTGDSRPYERLVLRLKSMSKEEIMAAMEAVAALDSIGDSRTMIDALLTQELIERDPILVLTQFPERLSTDRETIDARYSEALRKWASTDLANATAWLDEKIAAGALESKGLESTSRSRPAFEAALISQIFQMDFQAASRRIVALPESDREAVFGSFESSELKEDDHLAFSNFARSNLSEAESNRVIAAEAVVLVSKDGFSKVSDFLDRIGATPAERTASAEKAAASRLWTISSEQKVSRDDMDSIHQWLIRQTPSSSERVTGTLLASLTQGPNPPDFAEVADLVLHYHRASGSDELLASFLKSDETASFKEQARALTEKLSDGKLREEVLKKLE
jgi:hypothetical protein